MCCSRAHRLAGDRGIRRRGPGWRQRREFLTERSDEEGPGVFAYRVGSGRWFGEGASGWAYGAACIVEVEARVASLW